MYLVGKPLRTSEELQQAIDRSIPVAVYQHGKMIGKGGLIVSQSDKAVKFVDGAHYLKTTCEFRTR